MNKLDLYNYRHNDNYFINNGIHGLKEITTSGYDNLDKEIIITCSLTTICNYNCIYCANFENSKTIQNINYIDLLQFISNIHKLYSKKHIIIECSGGEPTLYSDLFELCQYLINLEYVTEVRIYSNFSLLIKCYLKILTLSKKIKMVFSCHLSQTTVEHIIEKVHLLNNYNTRFLVMYEKPIINSIKLYKKLKNLKFDTLLDIIFTDNQNTCYTINTYTQDEINLYFLICSYNSYDLTTLILKYQNNSVLYLNWLQYLKFKYEKYFNDIKYFKCCINPNFSNNICIDTNGDIFLCYKNKNNKINIKDSINTIEKYFNEIQYCSCKDCLVLSMHYIDIYPII